MSKVIIFGGKRVIESCGDSEELGSVSWDCSAFYECFKGCHQLWGIDLRRHGKFRLARVVEEDA
jgi:hypothetical protein